MFPRPTASPVAEPITLAEALIHLRETGDGGANDASIQKKITAVRQAFEDRTGCILISTPMLLTLEGWPSYSADNQRQSIDLKTGPLIAVQSVEYTDENGDEQTLSSAKYKVYTHLSTGVVGLAPSESWPAAQSDVMDAVRVAFTAGYGATASAVPEKAKEWMLCALTFLYEKRLEGLPEDFASGLIDRFKIMGH